MRELNSVCIARVQMVAWVSISSESSKKVPPVLLSRSRTLELRMFFSQ